MKQNRNVRICGDYRVTVNQAIKIDSYPLPRIEELFAKLSGGKYFSKLDLSQAYLQLQLDDDSKKLVTVNTHRGLFQYHRLPFGVSAAPAVFQRCIETLLQSCHGVSVYLDDILITGSTMEYLGHVIRPPSYTRKSQSNTRSTRTQKLNGIAFFPRNDQLLQLLLTKSVTPPGSTI